MNQEEILLKTKKYMLEIFKEKNRDYPLTLETFKCCCFENFIWENAVYRFDISSIYNILYLPMDSEFELSHKFWTDEFGEIVLENPVYNSGDSSSPDLPFYPGVSYFKSELDIIDNFLKQNSDKDVPVTGKRTNGGVTLTWKIDDIKLLQECNAFIQELEDSYLLRHKLDMSALLDNGYYSDVVSPHSWCEYRIDKKTGDIVACKIYDQMPPCLI